MQYEKSLVSLTGMIQLQDPLIDIGCTPFYLAYHNMNDKNTQQALCRMYRKACHSLNYVAPHCDKELLSKKKKTGKIKVGFVCNLLMRHTMAYFYNELIRRLDRDKFDVVVMPFESHPALDEINAYHRPIYPLSMNLEVARQQVAAHELDILVYPEIGMDPPTYFLAYSRLAPVQLACWGHPTTTGIDTIDYYLSCERMELDNAQAHYSEKLILAKNFTTVALRPYYATEPKRADYGLSDEVPLYVCPQSLYKYHPAFDQALKAILTSDRRGVVAIIEGQSLHFTERLLNRWKRTLGPYLLERIAVLKRQPDEQFCGLLKVADVVLDCFGWSGGKTTLESFAMGTPVITVPGEMMRGRVTAGLYDQMGLSQMICVDGNDYVGRALKIANDKPLRASLNRLILDHCGILFDNDGVVLEYEGILEGLYARI
jgi:predicted O-linked N-acetylglucosamine transferase (SPINDLY family)